MTKTKVSLTLDGDVADMLKEAAKQEGVNLSVMAERAVRAACIDYAKHVVEVTRLDNGGASVTVSRNNRVIYARRGVVRGTGMGIDGVVTIEVPGVIRKDEIARDLLVLDGAKLLKSAKPLSTRSGAMVDVSNVTMKSEGDPSGYMRQLLGFTSKVVEVLEVTSFRQIATMRCPNCGAFMTQLSVWGPPGGPEEREWLCAIGHPTNLGGTPPSMPKM